MGSVGENGILRRRFQKRDLGHPPIHFCEAGLRIPFAFAVASIDVSPARVETVTCGVNGTVMLCPKESPTKVIFVSESSIAVIDSTQDGLMR